MANLIRKTCTKLYQNRPRFVKDVSPIYRASDSCLMLDYEYVRVIDFRIKDMTKTLSCVFRFSVLTAVHLQNANANFHKVGT